ncbi:hypothetical protein JM16_003900 [Phytophthora kernoviae]|uniref:Uncharacterized protein n=1 Tax=Phytophthora kernoviae TaxID=325452 RepID=A0A8T0M159_9STRA|nr:hypothetical protein JM16_003900 [Phytophthora kernoviae]
MAPLSQLKYGLDLAGLFWFLVGNMWVISDGARCDDGSAMYQLALWMIVISYAKIFLPLQDPMRGKGATKEVCFICGIGLTGLHED